MTSTFGRSRRTWTSAAAVFIALVPPIFSGCTHSDTVLALTLTAAPSLAAVHHVRLTLSNAGASDVKVFPEATVTQAMTFPASLAVVIGGSRSGRVDVAVDGLDAAMTVIANGGIAVAISSGERTNATVELLAGPSECGNGVIDPGEECDDGNRVSGDGCDFMCMLERAFGDSGAGESGNALDATHDDRSGSAGSSSTGVAGSGDAAADSTPTDEVGSEVPAKPDPRTIDCGGGARYTDLSYAHLCVTYSTSLLCVLGCSNGGIQDPETGCTANPLRAGEPSLVCVVACSDCP